jgi:hypothetical protein
MCVYVCNHVCAYEFLCVPTVFSIRTAIHVYRHRGWVQARHSSCCSTYTGNNSNMNRPNAAAKLSCSSWWSSRSRFVRMYVCVYACMCVRMYYVCMYVHTHTHNSMHVYMNLCLYICMHNTYIHAGIFVYMYTIYINMPACMYYAFMHTHTHISCIHAYIYMYCACVHVDKTHQKDVSSHIILYHT